ncbi:DEAD/DEAH box helicase [Vulcanisaeta thermophila]|uniref:DEAD/DEAH box helicase n=1 Tax=Vulcanisaeta thermophila TaxID=867917 RepID=UPI0009FD4367|nr:DEAD/DEAH box helicase [Vulcanisaeta thermophila]
MINSDRLTVVKYILSDDFIKELSGDRAHVILYVNEEKPVEVRMGPSVGELGLPKQLVDVLVSMGVERLYEFQWESYRSIVNGESVVVMAGTGVGKTEAFLLPIIMRIVKNSDRALIIYPTKALARDQLGRINTYVRPLGISALPYDGDTPSDVRARVYGDPPSILITNPDMISEALAHVGKFRELISKYSIVVLDDFHVYNGVFGAHVHYVLRRLGRFMRSTQFVVSTATVGNPLEFARELLGVDDLRLIQGPMGRRGIVRHLLIKPIGRGRIAEAVELARVCVREGRKCLVFADSHRFVELMKRMVDRAGFGDVVRVHRAGLTVEERHEVEDGFKMGKYLVLLTTPTLELGIDIGDVDVAVMATIPPSYSKYLQRSGRVGRRGQTSYVIQILGDDPMSTYYTSNPREFYNRSPEPLFVESRNEDIARAHCLLMTYERPVRVGSLNDFCEYVLKLLMGEGYVEVRGNYYVVTPKGKELIRALRGIRGIGDVVRIVNERNRVIGHRELPMALKELHEGAVYMHGGRIYEVTRLDLSKRVAHVRALPNDYDLYTTALHYSEPRINTVISEGKLYSTPYQYADLTIKEVVYGYVVKRLSSGEVVATRRLQEPLTYEFRTKGIVIYAPLIRFTPFDAVDELERGKAYHALEHIMIMVGETLVGAGPTDMGGISFPTGHIVIYDSYPGGSGASKMLISRLKEDLNISLSILTHCSCTDGCPRCVYSPYCGNDNHYLSRRNAIKVAEAIINNTPGEVSKLPSVGPYD